MSDVSVSMENGALVARIRGEIDHHAAKAVREKIDAELFGRRPEVLVLDFSGVPFMDSSGIGLVIGRAAKAESIGGGVRLSGLSDSLMRVVRLSGLEKIKNLTIECCGVR